MRNWKLYAILDKAVRQDKKLKILAEEIIEGGADVIQLRDKLASDRVFFDDAAALREITKYYGVQFIVNDRVDVARAIGADGIHLGQDDLPIASARATIGKYGIIGVSCHSVQEAVRAQKDGADYIGLGAMYETKSKNRTRIVGPGIIEKVKRAVRLPIICIGGINKVNIEELIAAGAESVAISSAIIASRDPTQETMEFKKILERKNYDPVRICQK